MRLCQNNWLIRSSSHLFYECFNIHRERETIRAFSLFLLGFSRCTAPFFLSKVTW